MATEFSEGKVLITEIVEYDAIFFKDINDEEKICTFIEKHGGIVKKRNIEYDTCSPKILDEVIEFEYYGFSDYSDKYSVSFGLWILVSKDDEDKFIITNMLPDNCIKVKGEIC